MTATHAKPDSLARTDNDLSFTMEALIRARTTYAPYPFEAIISLSPNAASQDKLAKDIITKGYLVRPSYRISPHADTLPWQHETRAIRYALHSFAPIAPILAVYARDNSRTDYFDIAIKYVRGWIEHAYPANDATHADTGALWHPMAAGLRACALGYIADVLLRANTPDKALLETLLPILMWHCDYLQCDESFRLDTNHGIFQVLGQIALCRRFAPDNDNFKRCLELGRQRLGAVLDSQFFADGMHKEHSPAYHWIVLTSLRMAMNAELITDTQQLSQIADIEAAMSWLIQPNGLLPAIGDTDGLEITKHSYDDLAFGHPDLMCALGHNEGGTSPESGLRVFEGAGYAVLRQKNPRTERIETYLAQQAGFHSRTHKHADHLSFVWHDKGQDILVDAGKYGYHGRTKLGDGLWEQGFWYNDPKRIYVESTRAHNTIEIDGQNHARKDAKPFGSAIGRTAFGPHHLHAIETQVRHGSIRHDRVLFVCPRRFLIVFDWVKDNKGAPHDFRQWFHLAPNLDLRPEGDGLTVMRNGKPFAGVMSLAPEVQLETMVRGQMEPDLQGWVAHPKGGVLTPNWAFDMASMGKESACFATLFTVAPYAKFWQDSQIAPSGQKGGFYWEDRTGLHAVTFERKPDQDMKLTYKKTYDN